MNSGDRPQEPVENVAGNTNPDRPPSRPRSSIPSFLFISFVLFMLTNNRGDELLVRNHYVEVLETLNYQLSNYSSWLNGTASNFSLPFEEPTTIPLVESFMTFGSQLDPATASYYSNLTGFWHGDLHMHNLTLANSSSILPPAWSHLADEFGTNLNMSALLERLGTWNWTRSDKVSLSIGDKLTAYPDRSLEDVSDQIAMIHGKIELTDSSSSEDMRLDFDGVHFVDNGTIYAFAEQSGRSMDLRLLPSIVPPASANATARAIETELSARITKLKQMIDSGAIDSDPIGADAALKSNCSFYFFGQVDPSKMPFDSMRELEQEIDEPTGIATIRPPELAMTGVLLSWNCGMVLQVEHATGLKSQSLYRKMTTYAGISTLVYIVMLILLTRQVARSSSAAGLSRVSRYTFLTQSLIDAIAFVGHITLAVLADGRPSLAVLAPAGLACVLFIYEAQFAVLIGQIQAPEDIAPPAPASPAQPPPSAATTATNANATNGQTNTVTTAANPPVTNPPAANPPTTVPEQPSFLRFLWNHIRTDPSARLWTLMSLFLIVVFRIVIILSLPLFFVGSLYSSIWLVQIYRSTRRARSSGLSAEYLIGISLCRLFFALYFLACPKNILDVEPRSWIYGVAAFMLVQAGIVMLQESISPTLMFPGRMAVVQTYNYHPPLPLPDSESPEQSLGDCAICMDAIQADPTLRSHPRSSDGKEKNDSDSYGGVRRSGGILGAVGVTGARKNYSLAPCHHLFHTACLERWLAIKNVCPQCRRPLPPL